MSLPVRGARLAWPDVARGVSILGVVTLHVCLAVPGGSNTWLAAFNSVLDPLRLPLFFLVSGYFSTKVLSMSFPQLFCRRLWYFLVPYLCWGLAELYAHGFLYHQVFGDPYPGLAGNLQILALGHSMAWFLHSLIIYNCFLWLVRRLPTWQALLLSLAPVAALGLAESLYAVGKAVMFLPVFVAGALLRDYIQRFAEAIDSFRNPTWHTLAAYVVAIGGYVAGSAARDTWEQYSHPDMALPWITPGTHGVGTEELYLLLRAAEQLLELPLAVAVAVLIARCASLSGPLRFVGRHTLVIYLSHPIALSLGFGYLSHRNGWEISLAGTAPMGNTYFWIAVCLGLTAVTGVAMAALERIPYLRWTLKPPAIAFESSHRTAQPPRVKSSQRG